MSPSCQSSAHPLRQNSNPLSFPLPISPALPLTLLFPLSLIHSLSPSPSPSLSLSLTLMPCMGEALLSRHNSRGRRRHGHRGGGGRGGGYGRVTGGELTKPSPSSAGRVAWTATGIGEAVDCSGRLGHTCRQRKTHSVWMNIHCTCIRALL